MRASKSNPMELSAAVDEGCGVGNVNERRTM
jgi:hypothetical protein